MKKAFLISMLLMVTALPVSATEFYRYVDRHGNVLYTDDLSNVPPEQRGQVTAYAQSEALAPEPQADPQPQMPEKSAPSDTREQKQERSRLDAVGKALDQEFDALTQERGQLDEEKDQAVTNSQIKAYNEKISEFNARIKVYDEKRNAYAAEVKAFNLTLVEEKP